MQNVFRSTDGIEFPIDINVLSQQSQLFKNLVDNLGLADSNDETIIPIQVDSFNLKLVLKWAEHYKDFVGHPIDQKLEAESSKFISKWDFDFCRELNVHQLTELQAAAEYLEIPSLVTLCHKRIATAIKFCEQTKIRKIMSVSNDFTHEEENAVRKENEWYEDKDGVKF